MEHKIINTAHNSLCHISAFGRVDYLLIVDESEIKEGDLLFKNTKPSFVKVKDGWNNTLDLGYRKIIAHLPLNNSPILEGVDLLPDLPPLEDEVEKLAKHEAEKFHNKGKHDDWDIYSQLVYDTEMIKIGYNKAKEKYKYTEEDVLSAIEVGFDLGKNFDDDNPNIGLGWLIYQKDNFIKSIQQSKMPVGFKRSIERLNVLLDEKHISFPAKKTNSQGLTQWVGEYIYRY